MENYTHGEQNEKLQFVYFENGPVLRGKHKETAKWHSRWHITFDHFSALYPFIIIMHVSYKKYTTTLP